MEVEVEVEKEERKRVSAPRADTLRPVELVVVVANADVCNNNATGSSAKTT